MRNASNPKKSIRKSLDNIHSIKSKLDQIVVRAEADSGNGFPERTGEQSGVISHGTTDVTATLALSGRDFIEHRYASFLYHLRKIEHHSDRARTDGLSLLPMSHEQAQRIAEMESTKAALCENCQEVVTGVENDRLRRSRCRACWTHLKKNGVDRQVDATVKSKKQFLPSKRNIKGAI